MNCEGCEREFSRLENGHSRKPCLCPECNIPKVGALSFFYDPTDEDTEVKVECETSTQVIEKLDYSKYFGEDARILFREDGIVEIMTFGLVLEVPKRCLKIIKESTDGVN